MEILLYYLFDIVTKNSEYDKWKALRIMVVDHFGMQCAEVWLNIWATSQPVV